MSDQAGNTSRGRYQDICDKLFDCAEGNEGLDVYQMTAFYKYYHSEKSGFLTRYCFYVFKSLICSLLQTAGMCTFLYSVFTSMPDHVKLCSFNNKPLSLKFLATLLSICVSSQMMNLIHITTSFGIYQHIQYSPSFMASSWLYIGLYSNFFAAIASIFGSFLVIYSSQTAIELVLDSVALYFILEMDEYMIDHFDYKCLKKWLQNEFIFEKYFNKDQQNEKISTNGKCTKCMTSLSEIIISIGTVIALICSISAPILIAVCY